MIDKRLSKILNEVNNCMNEFFMNYPAMNHYDFYKYLNDRYGIQVRLDDNGKLMSTIEIIDDKKFFLFKIKYSYERDPSR